MLLHPLALPLSGRTAPFLDVLSVPCSGSQPGSGLLASSEIPAPLLVSAILGHAWGQAGEQRGGPLQGSWTWEPGCSRAIRAGCSGPGTPSLPARQHWVSGATLRQRIPGPGTSLQCMTQPPASLGCLVSPPPALVSPAALFS